MNRYSTLSMAFLAAFAPGLLSETLVDEEKAITNIPTEQLAWATTQEGAAFAPLIGQRFEEPYMAMVQLPAGLISPAHVKTANMFGVVISGTYVHVPLDSKPEDEVRLTAGSFYKIPANMPHISKCVSKEECITFLYQDGKFDFLPVKP